MSWPSDPRPESPPQLTCAQVDGLIEPWIDDELPATKAARVAGHCAACAACHDEADRARALRASLRRLPELQPPARVMAEVRLAALTDRHHPQPGSRHRAKIAAAAIAAAGLLAVWAGLDARHRAIDRAGQQARYALAVVAEAQSRTTRTLRDEVEAGLAAAPHKDRLTRILRDLSEAGPDEINIHGG